MTFNLLITSWYNEYKRDLPWRNTQDPYCIWLSEIILQQTRVNQGLPYYERFILTFPNVQKLALASQEEVLKLWQGLGYYSRARNLHETAIKIYEKYDGVFPKSYKDLLKLKGIGYYTAAAIASFAYNEAVPVVDGNVYRVLARYLGIFSDISLSSSRIAFFEAANQLMKGVNPALFNQAIMEFGALQCVPKSPNCEVCLLRSTCYAFQNNSVEILPVKKKKNLVSHRFINYLLLLDINNTVVAQKRINKGIWHNLYELPFIETTSRQQLQELEEAISQRFKNVQSITFLENSSTLHKLSHQHLHLQFWKVTLKDTHEKGYTFDELEALPMPIVIYNFIKDTIFLKK